MKRLFLITAGLLVGFMAGSWTPLGGLSIDTAKSLASKSDRLSSLIGLEEEAPTIISLSSTQMSIQNLAAGIQDLQDNREQFASIQKILGTKLDIASAANAAGTEVAQLGGSEVSALVEMIAAFEKENRQIIVMLASADPGVPETYALRCIYESNNQWVEVLRFLVAMNTVEVNAGHIAILKLTLDTYGQRVVESSFLGRMIVAANRASIVAQPPTNEVEKKQIGLALELLDAYNVAFDVEDTLAVRTADFATLMANAYAGIEVSLAADLWEKETSKLINDRALLQIYRKGVAQEFLGLMTS
jgi:hypothetical protein